jgi:hypothetical protein
MPWGRRRNRTMTMVERFPPVAFPEKRGNDAPYQIRRAVYKLQAKQIELSMQPFDADDLLKLFVEPEHRKTLVKAWSLVEPAGTTQELNVIVERPEYAFEENNGRLLMVFNWHRLNCENGFYVPHLAGAKAETAVHVRRDAPRELLDRFALVCQDLIDVHWRFAQVLKTFDRLNKPGVCATPAQMRYVWPCIHTLCRLAGYEALANEIATPSVRAGDKVRVPLDTMPLLHPTNDTIARAMFLQGVEPSVKPPIHYVFQNDFKTF